MVAVAIGVLRTMTVAGCRCVARRIVVRKHRVFPEVHTLQEGFGEAEALLNFAGLWQSTFACARAHAPEIFDFGLIQRPREEREA